MKLKKLNLINQFYPKTHIKVNLKKEKKKNTLVANCNFKGVCGGKMGCIYERGVFVCGGKNGLMIN